MARELEQFFRDDATDDAVRAVVVTGAGRAFCAGMDLSADGNVFGLDEYAAPRRPRTSATGCTTSRIEHGVRDTGGKVTLAIHELPKPVIAAINGAGRRHRRHDDAGDGHPARLDQGPDRLRLRAARHRPRGCLDVVPAAHRRPPAGAGVGLLRRHPHRRAGARRAPGPLGARARRAAAGRARPGPLASSCDRSPVALGLAKQLLYRNSAVDHPIEAHRADSLAMWHASIATARKASPPSGRSATPTSPAARASIPPIY